MIDEKKLINDITSHVSTRYGKLNLDTDWFADFIRAIEKQPKINEWIPCSERLPEEPFGCLVTIVDTNSATMQDFENILPYIVGYDGKHWNDSDGYRIPYDVIAWWPLPKPYKSKEDE